MSEVQFTISSLKYVQADAGAFIDVGNEVARLVKLQLPISGGISLKTVAKTDSTNLRLYWHVGEVIFNWECSVRRLKVHDPATGQWWDADEEGFIEVNQWHDIAWEIAPDSMRVLVDGKVRFERSGDWGSIEAPVAIGPCFGSTVTVRSLTVE